MAVVTVTLTIGADCDYWLTPKANEDITGLGVTVPDIVHGSINPADLSTSQLSLSLDNTYTWDVELTFRNAPPVYFQGFVPGSGGDLLELLSAQGWVSL